MPTLICDLGGVLFAPADPQRRIDAWRAANGGALGVSTGSELWDDALRGFEVGHVGEAEYILHLRSRLGWTGADEQLLHGWAQGQGPINLDVLESLSRLRDRGWQLIGAADDSPWDARARSEHFGWALALFDRIITAPDVGAARPDPRFFAGLRSVCGQGQRLYADADAHNVAAARRAGLDAHRFTDADALVVACRHLTFVVG